jgi:DMSO/TMAO reductase YedYZ heme-binding membrane subunit
MACVPVAALSSFAYVTGDPTIYVTYRILDGQVLYVISKLCALTALCTLWLQMVSGIAGSLIQQHLHIRIPHRGLGLFTTALVVAHVTLFVTAASIRSGHFAVNLLWPTATDYYTLRLALGLVALVLLLVAVGMRLSRAVLIRRWFHRLTYAAFALGMWHALSVGTEMKIAPLAYTLILIPITLAAVIAWRMRPRASAA